MAGTSIFTLRFRILQEFVARLFPLLCKRDERQSLVQSAPGEVARFAVDQLPYLNQKSIRPISN